MQLQFVCVFSLLYSSIWNRSMLPATITCSYLLCSSIFQFRTCLRIFCANSKQAIPSCLRESSKFVWPFRRFRGQVQLSSCDARLRHGNSISLLATGNASFSTAVLRYDMRYSELFFSNTLACSFIGSSLGYLRTGTRVRILTPYGNTFILRVSLWFIDWRGRAAQAC